MRPKRLIFSEQQKTTVVVNKPPAQNSNPIPNENNQKKNKPKQAELKPTEKTVISKEKGKIKSNYKRLQNGSDLKCLFI